MTSSRSSVFLFIFFLGVIFICTTPRVLRAANDIESQIDANNQQLDSLQAKIAEYQRQLNAIGIEKNTLQSTINALTLTQKKIATQMQVTQNKISSANLQIKKLSQSIGDKEESIAIHKVAIAKTLRTIYEIDEVPLITQIISSKTLDSAWRTADQAVQFNSALIKSVDDLKSVRVLLTTNRDQVTLTKKSLVSLQNDLTAQKRSVLASKNAEQELLRQTKNQESNFQKLLAAAKAELASFSAFTQNSGGSKLLANQTSCDSWGCYYSQRDVIWGNVPLNGTKFRLASDGCLVTSMAMMMTHYGYRNVTPTTINADPSNFASYYPAYLLFTIHVEGDTVTRIRTAIDSNLSGGNPVVVGVRAYGGTHYVVLTSGSRGKYLMRDPYIANGKDIDFTKHYSVGSIFSIMKVKIN